VSDYEKVVAYLRQRCDEIMGEWDGDNPGSDELRTGFAQDTLELLERLDELVKELDL